MTKRMQRYTILFIIANALHVSSGSRLSSGAKSVHAVWGICQTCLLSPLAWMRWDQSRLIDASGNSKQVWQITDAACTDLSSWWWAEKQLETCRALIIIKSIVQLCILLVMLRNTLTMHGPMNIKFRCGAFLRLQGVVANICCNVR